MSNSTQTWGKSDVEFFYALTPEEILRGVEAFGYMCTGRCSALNSMENRVYEIEIVSEETSQPRFLIAKFYRPGRWTYEQIQEEHHFLRQLQDHEIPVVAPITHPETGETLMKLQGLDIYIALFPKIGGRAPDELTFADYEVVGRLLGRMHTVGKSLTVKHRVNLNPHTYIESYFPFFESSTHIPEQLRNPLREVMQEIFTISKELFLNTSSHALHGDAHLGNLLNGRDGFYWVDFDDMVVGPAVQDLWLILPGRDQHALRCLEHLLKGYEMMLSFDKNSLRLIEALRSMRMIHFAAWVGIRWNDPAFQRVFPFYQEASYWQNLLHDLNTQRQILTAPHNGTSLWSDF